MGLILSSIHSGVYARDYSYINDHSLGVTRSATTENSSVLKSVVDATVSATMDSVFSKEEKDIIRHYYRRGEYRDRHSSVNKYDDEYGHDKKHKKYKKKKSLPPGLRKKLERGGELPPGWQKKVQRGEVMDVQLYYRSQPIPYDLQRKLPRQYYGAEVREIEGRIVRVLNATGAIIDTFDF